MGLMSNKSEYQTKEGPERRGHYTTMGPEKYNSTKEEEMSSWPEHERALAESQRRMTQNEVKTLCQGAAPWKTGIFLRGRVELFTEGWVNCCWVPKRDDAENEKNDCKTDGGNRKGKYKYLSWSNFWYIRKVFHSLLNTYKDSYKLLISRVSCSDEFLMKRLILSKKKRKSLIPRIS